MVRPFKGASDPPLQKTKTQTTGHPKQKAMPPATETPIYPMTAAAVVAACELGPFYIRLKIEPKKNVHIL
jgi:hypothetical protein